MGINRSSMRFQVTKPPSKGSRDVKEKATGRLRQESQKPIQGVAQRVRKRSGSQVPQGGRRELGKLY